MKQLAMLSAAATGLLLMACHGSRPAASAPSVIDSPDTDGVTVVTDRPTDQGTRNMGVNAVPNARIIKVHGCRPDVNVPITVSPDGKSVISFPAPSDLTMPMAVALADGYWLDCRGIGPDSRYTTFTVEEYKNLGDNLNPDYLLAHLGDAAWPTQIIELPFASSAENVVARADSLIRLGLPGCEYIYVRPNGEPMRRR